MAQASLTPLPPVEAIAALERRGQRLDPTYSWQDAWQDEHARMFTVAKSAGFDILKDIHAALVQALAEGRTFQDFAQDLKPVLQAKGWWGKQTVTDPATGEVQERVLGSTRRLRTIFDTNMRVSYAVGHWAHFERHKASRPVLRYVSLVFGKDRRKAHVARHNLCLPVDDPYWDRWATPCGWGCQCTLQSLSLRDVERMRGQLKFTPPPETERAYTNRRTGEVTRVPDGIDPGWAYNPGRAGWRASVVADKLADAPPALAAAAAAGPAWPAKALADEFEGWFDQAEAGQRLDRTLFTVGAADAVVLQGLSARGITLESAAITLQMQRAAHLTRDAKSARSQAVPLQILRRLPETIAAPKAVLLDKKAGALLYVFDVPGEANPGKLVVRINMVLSTRRPDGLKSRLTTNAIQTASLVDATALTDTNVYEILSGSL